MILEVPQPTDPKAFGERLRGLRVDHGVELEDISIATKISRRVLEAMESGSFEQLPTRVFSRNFVRQIAEIMGSDSEVLVNAFERAWEDYQEQSGQHDSVAEVDPLPRPAIRWRFWFPISVCGALLIAVAIVILGGSEPGQAALVEHDRRAGLRRVTDFRSSPEAEAVTAGDAARPAGGVVELTVAADGDQECWIRYRDREGKTQQRLIASGGQLELRLEGPAKLTVGNAAAARLVVDGVEYADLGVPGQVVHAEVSREGVTLLGAGSSDG